MAFCTQCGKELEDGQVCGCQKNFADNVQLNIDNEKAQKLKENSKNFANNILQVFLQILKKPARAGKEFIQSGNVMFSMAFIILQGIISGIIVMVYAGKVNSLLDMSLSIFSKNLKIKEATNILSQIKFQTSKVFMLALTASIIISIVITLIIWLMAALFKGSTSFSHMLCVSGIKSAGTIPFMLLALLLSFISVKWGIIFYITSAVAGYIFIGCVLASGAVSDANRMPYILFVTVIVSFLAYFITVTKMGPVYFSDTVRVAYNSMANELKSNMSKYSYDEIVSEALYGFIDEFYDS